MEIYNVFDLIYSLEGMIIKMKRSVKILLIAFLFCIYVYICKIDSIPTKTIIFEGEKLNIGDFLGISLNIENNSKSSILASTNLEDSMQPEFGNVIAKVKLFDVFTVKNVDVSVIKKSSVIPVGQIAGLKLYTHGVLVVGLGEITSKNNEKIKPYEGSGIEEGDTIVEIDNKEIIDTENLIDVINSSNGKNLNVKYLRNEQEFNTNLTPVKTSKNGYKIGLWVRDSAAGIGTLTYYDPENQTFAALGHGITDVDTGNLIDISNGDFLTTKVLSVVKGLKGNPGKIQGSIDNQKSIGKIYKNSNLGIYGKLQNLDSLDLLNTEEMEVADRNEIELGKAKILCSLDGLEAKEYEIEIEKIFINNNEDNKSMLIKITDESLLEKTGGIVQGMSGCPIIQNEKFIGAITNVLVNDPTSGYAVFADLMIKESMLN